MSASNDPVNTRPIVLTGLMGVGKTTVGALLSEKIRRRFYDADAEIEAGEGLSIPEIFKKKGEAYFRDLERKTVISLLSKKESAVISLGGGAVCNPDISAQLKKSAILVWLRANPDILFHRVKNDGGRPLLMNDDPLGTLRELATKRDSSYAQADVIVDTDHISAEDAADKILEKIYDCKPAR